MTKIVLPIIFLIIAAVCFITVLKKKFNKQNNSIEYYTGQSKQLEEYRCFRHDYKNKLAGLKALLDNEEYNRASEYLSDLLGEVNNLTAKSQTYSDNTLIDAVLQDLAVRCENADIKFDASVIVGNELLLSDVDTCAVFYNIANNAYEAASKEYDGEKFINFITSRRQKWLIITAENSFDGNLVSDDDGQIKTLKNDTISHGHGLKNIKRIVESVPGASVKLETEGNIFKISLIFSK